MQTKIEMLQDLAKELADVKVEMDKLELIAGQMEESARAMRNRHTRLTSLIGQLRVEWGIEETRGAVERLPDGTLRFMPK